MTNLTAALAAQRPRSSWQRPQVSRLALRAAENTPNPIGSDGTASFGS
jgi:hypothetical protein